MAPAAGRVRAKGVTDPLDDKVKARIRGDDYRLARYVSSGSDHEGGDLSGFVDGLFFSDTEEDGGAAAPADGGDLDEEDDAGSAGSDGEGDHRSLPPVAVPAMVRDLLNPSAGDRFRRDLVASVTAAIENLSGLRCNRSSFRRAVMSSLRDAGYNAGICKAMWERRGGVTAGSYEYIDVIRPPPGKPASSSTSQQQQQRYVVDVEFAAEFEIARPTAEYGRVAGELPRVYVGRSEDLKRLLRLLADAAKRSLRSRGLHVPPWRGGRYMQAKWLGPYRRTVNPAPSGDLPAAAPPPPSFTPGREVKCRCVGFDATAQLALPPATRTR